MARRDNISSTNTRDNTGGRSRGRGYGRFSNNRGRGGCGSARGNGRGSGRTSYGNKSNPTGYYDSPADWSKLSFEERNKIRKDRLVNLAGPTSALLVTFLLNKSPPLSAPSSSTKLRQTQLNQQLLKPPTTKLAMLLAGKKAPRNSV
jgi:hypothetical protein